MEHSYTEDCQQMLRLTPSCSGWLRTKNAVHIFGDAIGRNISKLADVSNRIVKFIPWPKHFVILFDKVIYIFKDETCSKPERRIRLNNFQGVEAMTTDIKEVPWPFKLTKNDGHEEVFAAMSQDEQQKWLKAFQEYLDKNDEYDTDYEEPFENPNRGNLHQPTHANSKSPRGPLPAIPGEYDDPDEDDNSSSENNLRLNNNNFNSRNEKPYKRTVEGNSGPIKQPGQFVPVLPFDTPLLKKTPVPSPPNDSDRLSMTIQKCKPSLQSTPQKNAQPIVIKKSPPMPPVPPKPNLEKTVRVEHTDAKDHLEYELGDLTNKAMWNGLLDEARSTMSKLLRHEGAFLLRVCSQGLGYTLHVVCDGKSKKFSIKEEENGEFTMGGRIFKSIEDLLLHFKDNSLPSNDVRLGKPYSELC